MDKSDNMSGVTISNNALKRENVSASANVLMCKQWWKVCWMYGDQEKYYRQLYGKRAGDKLSIPDDKKNFGTLQQNELPHNIYENTNPRSQSEIIQANEVYSVEEVSSPSPSVGRTRSPGINSLELARGLDE